MNLGSLCSIPQFGKFEPFIIEPHICSLSWSNDSFQHPPSWSGQWRGQGAAGETWWGSVMILRGCLGPGADWLSWISDPKNLNHFLEHRYDECTQILHITESGPGLKKHFWLTCWRDNQYMVIACNFGLGTYPQCSVRANCRNCSGGEVLEVGEHVAHCAPVALPLLLIRAPLICDQQPIRSQYSLCGPIGGQY